MEISFKNLVEFIQKAIDLGYYIHPFRSTIEVIKYNNERIRVKDIRFTLLEDKIVINSGDGDPIYINNITKKENLTFQLLIEDINKLRQAATFLTFCNFFEDSAPNVKDINNLDDDE